MHRLILLALGFAGTLLAPAIAEEETKSLFNGKDLSGWHVDVPHQDKHPQAKPTFIVREGMLVSLGSPNGHIITDAEFENYRLEVEYRFAGKPGKLRRARSRQYSQGTL